MRIRWAITAVLVVVAAGACGLGNKDAIAKRITTAAKRAESAGPARATVSLRTQVIKSRLPVAPGPPRLVSAAAPDLKAVIDFPSGQAAVGFVGDDPASAAMVFAGNTVFQRRLSLPAGPQAAAAAGAPTNLLPLAASAKLAAAPPAGLPPTVAPPTVAPTTTTTTPAAGASRLHRSTKIQRNWLSFDYASIPKRNTDKTAGSFVINPVAIERLLDGTLTGSVRQVEPGHYKLNVNRDKAERHLSVKQKKDLDKTFRANAIHGRVFPADVWLDATGNLTRMTVRFRQTLTNIDRDDLYVTLDLAPSAAPGAIALPDPKETAVVQNLGQLVRGALGS